MICVQNNEINFTPKYIKPLQKRKTLLWPRVIHAKFQENPIKILPQ